MSSSVIMALATVPKYRHLKLIQHAAAQQVKTATQLHAAEPPHDKKHLIYIILLFHGIGTLIAWNMFITAKDYFVKFKLANTVYAQNFLAYMGWACQIPNFCFNWLNVFVNVGGSLTYRIIGSVIIEVFIFLFTIILAMVDTSSSPGLFFCLTLISVFFLNGFNAIYQNSVFGVAARLPPQYMAAYMLGNNVCGTIVVFMSWLSTFFKNLRTSAIYYFICGMTVLIICLDTYIALPLNKCYRHYMLGPHEDEHDRQRRISGPLMSKVPYKLIFRQTWVQLYNIFVTFFVTLAVFPAVISDIEPVKEGFLGKYFVLVTCFLTFSVTAMIGNITAGIWRIPNKNLLFVLTTLRFIFIPFFLLCNYQVPGRTLQVKFTSDWVFWLGAMLFGWSSGHASSLALIYVGGEVIQDYSAKAGMIGAAMLMTGICSGILVTRLAPVIVTMKMWAEQ